MGRCGFGASETRSGAWAWAAEGGGLGAGGGGGGGGYGGFGGSVGGMSSSMAPSAASAEVSTADCLVGALTGHVGDVYSVNFHPTGEQVVTAGYDKTVRIFDSSAGVESRLLVGHELPTREAVFNATGNLVVSGGRTPRCASGTYVRRSACESLDTRSAKSPRCSSRLAVSSS